MVFFVSVCMWMWVCGCVYACVYVCACVLRESQCGHESRTVCLVLLYATVGYREMPGRVCDTLRSDEADSGSGCGARSHLYRQEG
jgi:hypothetical protein